MQFHSCKKKKKDDLLTQILSYLVVTNSPADNYSKMYRIVPTDAGSHTYSLENLNDFTASALVDHSRKKLILVHGWYVTDLYASPFPGDSELRARITDSDNWGDFLSSGQLWNAILLKNYDVFAYDYLTSESVDSNGTRFRALMDRYFSGESSTVVIYAHSMGGLVTRFALYEGDAPAYLNKIISTGTPYHGSPWASRTYYDAMSGSGYLTGTVASIATFLTGTTGGQDLRWDNFDSSISGAENQKLTDLNAKTDRDSYITAYYGSCTLDGDEISNCSSPNTLAAACSIMEAVNGGVINSSNFNPADCIVPAVSATLQTMASGLGNSAFGVNTWDAGDYDHIEVKMGNDTIKDQFYSDLP